jgi:hypothetical protein
MYNYGAHDSRNFRDLGPRFLYCISVLTVKIKYLARKLLILESPPSNPQRILTFNQLWRRNCMKYPSERELIQQDCNFDWKTKTSWLKILNINSGLKLVDKSRIIRKKRDTCLYVATQNKYYFKLSVVIYSRRQQWRTSLQTSTYTIVLELFCFE